MIGVALSFVVGVAHVYSGDLALLEDQVQSGNLSRKVLDQIEVSGEAEILVSFNVDDIREAAAATRRDLGLTRDNAEIVAEKEALYAEIKSMRLSWLSRGDYEVLEDYEHFPILFLRVNGDALSQLLETGGGIRISENKTVYTCLDESLPLIGAFQAHSVGATGSGTSVAVLDTGVDYMHPAFGNCTEPGVPAETCRVAYAADFTEYDDGFRDDHGHGTNVSGIVAGVAPDTKILALDVIYGGGASYSDLIDAMEWVMANQETYKIVAVNMSLGYPYTKYTAPCPWDGLAGAVTDLKAAGIATVISAGNQGYTDGISAPGCVPDAISVGAVYDSNVGSVEWSSCEDATTWADKITCFSNFAWFMTLLAPGAWISAAGIPMGGTSQASPHVAGAVAVLRGEDNGITVDEMVQILTETGVPIADNRPGGSGIEKPRIDLYDAVLQLPDYTLTVVKNGTGSGTVSSTDPSLGIDCGPDCSETYDTVTTVTLSAVPDSPSELTGWSVPGCGVASQCQVTVDTSKTVTATFTLLPPDADFHADVLEGPAPLSVHFTDDSTLAPHAWEWDFTDSGTTMSTEQNPTYVYNTAGSYTVSLTAYNGGGSDTETKTHYITVTQCETAPVKTGGSYYPTLQTGYAAAVDGAVIYARAVEFIENLDLNDSKTVSFDWGWNCDFTESLGEGGFTGTLTISGGTLVVDGKTVIGM